MPTLDMVLGIPGSKSREGSLMGRDKWKGAHRSRPRSIISFNPSEDIEGEWGGRDPPDETVRGTLLS